MMTETPELLPLTKNWSLRKLNEGNPQRPRWALQYMGMDWHVISEFLSSSENGRPTLDDDLKKFANEVAALTRVPPSTVVGSGAALAALLAWCQIERGKLVVDGYDYKSGEEFGLRRVELQIERAIRSTPTLASEKEGGKADLAKVQAAADEVVAHIVEWDDRTSPEDFPEALLITPSELHRELVRFATDIGVLAPPAASLIAKGEGK